MHPKLRNPGLYAITDGPRDGLLAAVAQALEGGARLVQYRDKSTDPARRHAEAAALREVSVILVVLFGMRYLKEPFGRPRLIACGLVLIGMLVMKL